jgi:hypothetical protein
MAAATTPLYQQEHPLFAAQQTSIAALPASGKRSWYQALPS